MYISDINPHIRFATALHYEMNYNRRTVKVSDCRIFYVIDGTAQLQIGQNNYSLMADSLFYCCAGSTYSVNTQKGFSLIILNFDLSQAHSDHKLPISPVSDLEETDKMPIFCDYIENSSFLNDHLFFESAAHLRSYAEQIVEDYSGIHPFSRESGSARLKLLLLQMHATGPKNVPQKLSFVKNYLQQNFAKKITNKELADLVGYHEYYLNRIFRTHIGMSLHDYLLKIRLNRAGYLLLNTDLSLQEIAEAVGFNSYAHFSAYYKQAFGLSPTQYRKQMKRNI